MNNIEKPNLESVSKPKNSFHNKLIRTGAATAATFIALTTFSGCQETQATTIPTTTITETTNQPTTSGSTIETTLTPTTTETTKTPTTTTTKETTKATTKVTTVETTQNVDLYAKYLKDMVAKYDSELKECKPELKEFCSKLLNVVDNSVGIVQTPDVDPETTKIQNFLKRETVINYGKTGQGLETVNFKDGKPAFAFVHTDKAVIQNARDAISAWQKDVPNFLEAITDNGMCVFYQYKFNPQQGNSASYDKNGIFAFNYSKETGYATNDITKTLRIHLGVESFGIKALILKEIDPKKFKNLDDGVTKQVLARDNCQYLYLKTKNSFYSDRVKSYQKLAEIYSGGNPDGIRYLPYTQKIKEGNLIKPYGASNWQEIDLAISGGK